ncbi:hypothetical protein J3R83DRAFT_10386 [Lanmaoa asiatica]|nr:hypothetical protein J3R83DRAFT_10386 [Lanmaoa asiatica]
MDVKATLWTCLARRLQKKVMTEGISLWQIIAGRGVNMNKFIVFALGFLLIFREIENGSRNRVDVRKA